MPLSEGTSIFLLSSSKNLDERKYPPTAPTIISAIRAIIQGNAFLNFDFSSDDLDLFLEDFLPPLSEIIAFNFSSFSSLIFTGFFFRVAPSIKILSPIFFDRKSTLFKSSNITSAFSYLLV